MGVTGSAFQHSRTAPPAAKDKRKRKPKSQSRRITTGQNAAVTAKATTNKSRGQKPLGPGTQPGAHQQLPITIDSDDEAGSVASLETSVSAAVRNDVSESVHLLDYFANSHRAYSLPAAPLGRATSYPHSPGSSAFSSRNLPSRSSSSTLTAPFQRPLVRNPPPSSSASSYPDDRVELTLADIKDLDLRQKTAQLMAVAPGLPVSDLCRLLIDRRGHFEAAKQDVLRLSQAPPIPLPARKQFAPARASTLPLTAPIDAQAEAKDDTYIKIDFDDPDFIFDNDAPATPAEPGRRRSKVPAKAAEKPTKSSPHSPGTPKKLPVKVSPCPRRPSRAAKPRKGHAFQGSNGESVRDINRGMRETSHDRSFIAPDDEILVNSDDTYSDHESEACDVDMTNDGTDLTIDMESEYAYNLDFVFSLGSR